MQRILIAGYGREGRSSEQYLRQHYPTAQLTIVEGNDNIRHEASRCYDLIIKSPGVPSAIFDGLCDPHTISSQTDLFLQRYAAQTIGITGTKGKSTTTALLYHILHDAGRPVIMAGNMGIPLFNIIPSITPSTMVVAELSCHQLEHIHRSPHIALLLNLYQEHLDHYPSYDDYKLAKLQIALHQQADDHFIYCADNDELRALVDTYRPNLCATLHPYSLHSPIATQIATMSSLLPGAHNCSNAISAYIAAQLQGISSKAFAQSLATFHGLPHRLELVGTYHGITFVNDSISTIPQATLQALTAYPDCDTLILGGFDRGIDYSPLTHYLTTADAVHNIAFVGQAGRRIHHELLSLHPSATRTYLLDDDYDHIVRWCYQVTHHTCLLSPAAASYDAFRNFEQRGDTFRQLVAHYGSNN